MAAIQTKLASDAGSASVIWTRRTHVWTYRS